MDEFLEKLAGKVGTCFVLYRPALPALQRGAAGCGGRRAREACLPADLPASVSAPSFSLLLSSPLHGAQLKRNSTALDKYKQQYVPPGVPQALPDGAPLLVNRV